MNLRTLVFSAIIIFILQACSVSGNLSSDDTRTYSKPFGFIEKAVKGAINGSGLEIDGTSKSLNPQETTFELVRASSSNSKGRPQEPGSVTILMTSASKTQVIIINPVYDNSVLSTQRLNYQVILFPRIEKLIELNS